MLWPKLRMRKFNLSKPSTSIFLGLYNSLLINSQLTLPYASSLFKIFAHHWLKVNNLALQSEFRTSCYSSLVSIECKFSCFPRGALFTSALPILILLPTFWKCPFKPKLNNEIQETGRLHGHMIKWKINTLILEQKLTKIWCLIIL